MPRLKKGEAEQREQFMISLFRKDANLSIPKANKAMQEKFGSKIRLQRAYELRRIAAKGAPVDDKPVTAARKAAKLQKTGVRNNFMPRTSASRVAGVVVIEGQQPEIEFLTKALQTMEKQGLTVPQIDHRGDTYVVVLSP